MFIGEDRERYKALTLTVDLIPHKSKFLSSTKQSLSRLGIPSGGFNRAGLGGFNRTGPASGFRKRRSHPTPLKEEGGSMGFTVYILDACVEIAISDRRKKTHRR